MSVSGLTFFTAKLSIATAASTIVYRLFLQNYSSGVKVMRKSKSDIVCFITDREVLALYQITVKF